VEILVALYENVLSLSNVSRGERDRFILSKGHAALALYATLHLKGLLTRGDIDSFLAPGSNLGVHPERCVPGIDFSTGSLGHGLSMGAGAALAARLQSSTRRVFVLISDGECNEGSVWEAAMFAAHRKLGNLVAIVDANGQQAFGRTRDVLDTEPLAERWTAFGWHAVEVDGHNVRALTDALRRPADSEKPTVAIARTVFGKGVSFMEGQIPWHYLPMDADQYQRALQEVAQS
jgi:transketolase